MANQVKAAEQADRKTWVKPELVSLKNSADALNVGGFNVDGIDSTNS